MEKRSFEKPHWLGGKEVGLRCVRDLKRHWVEKKKDHTCFNALFKCEKMALMRCDTNYYYEALGEKKREIFKYVIKFLSYFKKGHKF